MRARHRVATVLAIAAIAFTAAPSALADPTLATTDAALTMSALATSARTDVCNPTSTAVAVGVAWPTGAVALGDQQLAPKSLFDTHIVAVIGAGICETLSLTLTAVGASAVHGLGPGESLNTSLTVVSDGAGVATVPITVTGPPAAQPHTLIGPSADVKLSAHLGLFGSDGVELDGDAPAIVLEYADSPPDTIEAKTTVSDGSHLGTVIVKDDTDTGSRSDRAARLMVTLEGADERGTYQGTLVLDQAGKDRVPITIVVADSVRGLLLVTIAGIAIGMFGKLLTGRFRYSFALRSARNALRYPDLPAAWGANFRKPFLGTFRKDSKAAWKAYLKKVVTVDPAADSFISVHKQLGDAYDDAMTFGGRLPASLDALRVALLDTVAFVEQWQPEMPRPVLMTEIGTLLRIKPATTPAPLRVGEATKIADRADELAGVLAAWRTALDAVLRHQQWHQKLAGLDGLGEDEMRRLAQAAAALDRARAELSSATTTPAVDAVRTRGDLLQAHANLAFLGAPHDVWIADQLEVLPSLPRAAAPAEIKRPRPDLAPPPTLFERWFADALEVSGFDVAVAYVIAHGSRWVEYGIVAFQAALAYVGAYFVTWQTLYDGKPFGSGADYLGALLAGTAATVVIDAVINGLNRVRGGLGALTSKA